MKILNCIRNTTLAMTIIYSSMSMTKNTMSNTNKSLNLNKIVLQDDLFKKSVPPEGSTDSRILAYAPNPDIIINGKNYTAKIIVDLSQNILYKYNEIGNAEKAYLIASGKKNTPTDKGVRIVTHIENYPYNKAPLHTKRRNNPNNYGPNIICLNKINTEDGTQRQTGEFIHGNNNPSSIGKYASMGCIRMNNNAIKTLAKVIKRGDIVVIK